VHKIRSSRNVQTESLYYLFTATAKLAGIVHGVVVQIATLRSLLRGREGGEEMGRKGEEAGGKEERKGDREEEMRRGERKKRKREVEGGDEGEDGREEREGRDQQTKTHPTLRPPPRKHQHTLWCRIWPSMPERV
jgi:hypothetical protein